MVGLGGQRLMIDPPLTGQRVTLRFHGQLMHVISGNRLVKTLPAPLDMTRRGKLTGARSSTSPLPPSPFESLRAIRRVPADGIAMVADVLAAGLPASAWQRKSAGRGAKGHRYYDWSFTALPAHHDAHGGHHWLLIRRNRSTGELAFYRCWSSSPPAATPTPGSGRSVDADTNPEP
jgi:hypothetical protein